MSNKSKVKTRKLMKEIYKQVDEDKKKRAVERRKATVQRQKELGLPHKNAEKKPSEVTSYKLSAEELEKYKR